MADSPGPYRGKISIQDKRVLQPFDLFDPVQSRNPLGLRQNPSYLDVKIRRLDWLRLFVFGVALIVCVVILWVEIRGLISTGRFIHSRTPTRIPLTHYMTYPGGGRFRSGSTAFNAVDTGRSVNDKIPYSVRVSLFVSVSERNCDWSLSIKGNWAGLSIHELHRYIMLEILSQESFVVEYPQNVQSEGNKI